MTNTRCKKGWPSSLTKISSEIGFLSVDWAIPEKRWELTTYFFEKKQLEFSSLLFHPWKLRTKQSYSFLTNPSNYMIPIGSEAKFCVFFSLLPLKILVISCLAPGNSTLYFFNIPGKSKSWNSQFQDFI